MDLQYNLNASEASICINLGPMVVEAEKQRAESENFQ